MAKVRVKYSDKNRVLAELIVRTTGDHAYIFDDISNELMEDGELKAVPKGTKKITLEFDVEGY